MPDPSKAINTVPEMEGSDDSEDEDYSPEKAAKSKETADPDDSGADSETEDKLGDYDSGDEKVAAEHVDTENGAAVKTRSQRAQETTAVDKGPAAPATEASKIDALWAAMNDPNAVSTQVKPPTVEAETIEITRTYEFAGQVHTEKKTVLKESQEARDFLDAKAMPEKKRGPVRRGMKRRSILDEEAGLAKVKKINTLEKSRMEWSGFVDKEGINDELKRANKNGYLDKQDFLNKTHSLQHDRSLNKKH